MLYSSGRPGKSWRRRGHGLPQLLPAGRSDRVIPSRGSLFGVSDRLLLPGWCSCATAHDQLLVSWIRWRRAVDPRRGIVEIGGFRTFLPCLSTESCVTAPSVGHWRFPAYLHFRLDDGRVLGRENDSITTGILMPRRFCSISTFCLSLSLFAIHLTWKGTSRFARMGRMISQEFRAINLGILLSRYQIERYPGKKVYGEFIF